LVLCYYIVASCSCFMDAITLIMETKIIETTSNKSKSYNIQDRIGIWHCGISFCFLHWLLHLFGLVSLVYKKPFPDFLTIKFKLYTEVYHVLKCVTRKYVVPVYHFVSDPKFEHFFKVNARQLFHCKSMVFSLLT
jgi:hypothetical protein